MALTSSEDDPLAILSGFIKDLTVPLPSHPKWGYLLNDKGRMNEIIDNMSKTMCARFGKSTIPVAAGGGKLLAPFWEVALEYSFETGALWKKKSVQVSDTLMIYANFVIDVNALNDPAYAITDIFSDRPKNGKFAGIKGTEVSMSSGSGLKAISDSVSDQTAGGRDIMMPLSTKKEAEKLCGEYLAKLAASDKKFKLSKPTIKRLIFIPCTVSGNGVTCEALSNMVPEMLGKLDVSRMTKY